VLALKYFAEQQCDLVIWETGMGGRLDATNIVTPLASVITNVQLDHQQWLGETLPQIAAEKAGIIKDNVPVITGETDPSALRVIAETAKKHHAPLTIVTPSDAKAIDPCEIALSGAHQQMNAALVMRTVQILNQRILVSDAILRRGLKETQWAGRCQIIQRKNGQTILLDGAHNPDGAQSLAETWRHEFPGKNAALILGMMRDKDCKAICDILAPLARRIFPTAIGTDRSADPNVLAEHCRRANSAADISVSKNLSEALAKTEAEPYVVIAGSLYFAGEALEALGVVPASGERALNEYVSHAPIRAVTFDAGGTLIEPWPSVGDVYGQVAGRHGIQVSPKILNERFVAAWKARKKFGYTKSEWSELVDQTFAGLAATKPSASFFLELYEEFAGAEAWRIYDDVRPCLERLRNDGVKLGIISNWDERLRPLLAKLDLDQYFDVIIVSAETGHHKPAPEIFRDAAGQLQVPPASILHVGDSRREDVEGAQAAGFQALLLTRGAAAADGAIDSLDKVPATDSKAALIPFNSIDASRANH
jgi:folylpolyglutamate synthase/dihydrofolate synthase/REG-2-like HAD superfamily hydrolase